MVKFSSESNTGAIMRDLARKAKQYGLEDRSSCCHCAKSIDQSQDHPVIRMDDMENPVEFHFCSKGCEREFKQMIRKHA
ncbi:MAG: hypothetical protein ABEI86_11545 [Halobacteriaceae archaeon]